MLSIFITILFRVPYLFSYFSHVDERCYLSQALKLSSPSILIYKDVVENKGPLLPWLYQFFVVTFGFKAPFFFHLLSFLILVINSLLVYKIVKKYVIIQIARLSLVLYPLISTLFFPDCINGASEFFIPTLLLLFWLSCISDNKWLVLTGGVSAALIVLFKQIGILLIFVGVFYYIQKKQFKYLFLFISGYSSIIIFFVSYLLFNNSLQDFYLWGIEYALFFSSKINILKKIYYFIFPMMGRIFLLVPFITVFSVYFFLKETTFKKHPEIFYLLIFSSLWGFLQGRPFPHYYIPFLSTIFIVTMIGFNYFTLNFSKDFNKKLKRTFYILTSFLILQSSFYWHGFDYYKKWINFIRRKQWSAETHKENFKNLIGYIKTNTTSDDKIVVWGWVPATSIYWFSQRVPGTRFVFPEPVNGNMLIVPPKIQSYPHAIKLYLKDIDNLQPKYFIDASDVDTMDKTYNLVNYPEIMEHILKKYTFEKYIEGFKIYAIKECEKTEY